MTCPPCNQDCNQGRTCPARQPMTYSVKPVDKTDYNDFETQRRVMLEYMQLMIARSDWHGVADAAMDLREMDAEKRGKAHDETR